MTVKLVLNNRAVRALIASFGPERVTVLEPDGDSFSYITFEVNSDMDVLRVFHAGTDSGLELGLYGTKGKPVEEAKELLEAEEK